MYCQNCGKRRRSRRQCFHCGHTFKRNYRRYRLWLSAILLIVGLGASYFFYGDSFVSSFNEPASVVDSEKTQSSTEEVAASPSTKSELDEDKKTELTDVIADAQETVYTIFAGGSQGSGFLYNDEGIVVTNAHVVEGVIDVFIQTVAGEEFLGSVIGYSNETDVAVIKVPDLAGQQSYTLEKSEDIMIGEEVVALGSPLGLENTATMGYITGKNRSFTLAHYTYENVYQMSAPISPGSSGGPLISKDSEKIIAINSATVLGDSFIGFSIPIFKIADLIQAWIDNPMTEDAILAQFYNANGDLFFHELWRYGEEGYFDGGEYSDEETYHDYWEYDYGSYLDDDQAGWGSEGSYYDDWSQSEYEDDSYYDDWSGSEYEDDSYYDYYDEDDRWYWDQYDYFIGDDEDDEWDEEGENETYDSSDGKNYESYDDENYDE